MRVQKLDFFFSNVIETFQERTNVEPISSVQVFQRNIPTQLIFNGAERTRHTKMWFIRTFRQPIDKMDGHLFRASYAQGIDHVHHGDLLHAA
jgi:hypothetical protein